MSQPKRGREGKEIFVLCCFSCLDQLNDSILQTTTINGHIVTVEGAENR